MTNKQPKLVIVKPHPAPAETDLTFVMAAQSQFANAYGIAKDDTTQELYVKLVEEEHEEWVEEFYGMESKNFDELKELADVLYVTAGLYYQIGYTFDKTAKYKLAKDDSWDFVISKLVEDISIGKKDKRLLLNLMYAIFSYADTRGWDLEEAYARVHRSNMSKLGVNGKPVRREDGKVLKGPNYKPPYLEDLTDGK